MPNVLMRIVDRGNIDHHSFTAPDNPIGNAIAEWAKGVKTRAF